MSTLARVVDVRYEASTEQHGLDRDYVKGLAQFAFAAVGKHAGLIVPLQAEPTAVRLRIGPSDRVDPDLRVSPAPYSLFITRRHMTPSESPQAPGASRDGFTVTTVKDGVAIRSKSAIRALSPHEDPFGGNTLLLATHEVAHSVGLHEHCSSATCVMNESIENAVSQRGHQLLTSGEPFCADCQGKLRALGRRAAV
jgi:hypothetical protein